MFVLAENRSGKSEPEKISVNASLSSHPRGSRFLIVPGSEKP